MVQLAKSNNLVRITPPFSALEAFPISLSIIHLAGFQDHLDEKTISELRETEIRLQKTVSINKILRARTDKGFEKAFKQSYNDAISYYVTSGITIWRAINYDYKKLHKLSQVSCKLIDELFFKHIERLDRYSFTKSVVGLRVLRSVGEKIILAEENSPPNKQTPPLSYLNQIINATFMLWCILSYLQGDVKNVRRSNLKILADGVFSVASDAYSESLQSYLYKNEAERNYWDPIWQEGEVEADIDKHLGDVIPFTETEITELMHLDSRSNSKLADIWRDDAE